jgi:hypothetical protein
MRQNMKSTPTSNTIGIELTIVKTKDDIFGI